MVLFLRLLISYDIVNSSLPVRRLEPSAAVSDRYWLLPSRLNAFPPSCSTILYDAGAAARALPALSGLSVSSNVSSQSFTLSAATVILNSFVIVTLPDVNEAVRTALPSSSPLVITPASVITDASDVFQLILTPVSVSAGSVISLLSCSVSLSVKSVTAFSTNIWL